MSDLIDRCNLRLMRAEECAGHTIEYALGWKACIEWMKTLPSAQPDVPDRNVGDMIRRQEAVDALDKLDYTPGEWAIKGLTMCKDAIKAVPSAQPEQKVGKWIKMSDADGVYYCCSECGEDLHREWSFDRDYDLFPRKKTIDKTKYCPNCGAKMEEQDG